MPAPALTEEQFLKDVANHRMAICQDDGLCRRVKFRREGTSDMAFELVTWPWRLAITGDMGDFTFSRLEDMFAFFRVKPEGELKSRIDTGYWGSKCIAQDRAGGGVEKRSKHTPQFLWCCYAIAWGIRQYDAAPKPAKANTLTCVYCGHAYPEGTPPHGSQILTDHIAVCEKHPMRKVVEDRMKLRTALCGLIGATTPAELEGMRSILQAIPGDDENKTVSLAAINTLLETA